MNENDMTKKENIFKRAAEMYVNRKNIEYPEFYLKELSKLLGYDVTMDHLKTIIDNEIEIVCERDTAVPFNFMPEIGMNIKVIRGYLGTGKPIFYLNCKVSGFDEEKMQFTSELVYDRNRIELPIKSEDAECIFYDDSDRWKFKF